jgi:hypothetical protein
MKNQKTVISPATGNVYSKEQGKAPEINGAVGQSLFGFFKSILNLKTAEEAGPSSVNSPKRK